MFEREDIYLFIKCGNITVTPYKELIRNGFAKFV